MCTWAGAAALTSTVLGSAVPRTAANVTTPATTAMAAPTTATFAKCRGRVRPSAGPVESGCSTGISPSRISASTGARQPRGVVHTGPAEPNPATMRKTSGYA
ncbi:hypothetical protein GCM10029964_019850 [Kibdelosporangium lantanae]